MDSCIVGKWWKTKNRILLFLMEAQIIPHSTSLRSGRGREHVTLKHQLNRLNNILP